MDKDYVDTLLKFADASWHEMDTRRSYEWKVNFGLWTTLGVLAGVSFKGETSSLPQTPMWMIALVLLLFPVIGFVYIFIWTKGLYARNQRNMRRAHYYWNLVETELNLSPRHQVLPEDVSEPYWRNWSVLSQVLITVIFMLIAFLALYGSALRGVQTQGHSTAGQTQTNRTRADRDPKSNSHIIAPGSAISPLAFDELAGALGGAHDGFDERDAQTHLTAEQV